MKYLKQVGSLIVGLTSFIATIASLIAIRFSIITFVILLILEITKLISIGLWVIWIPLIMIFGGLFSVLFNLIVLSLLTQSN